MSDDTLTVVRRHLAAWQKGDVEALVADFAEDGVMLTEAGGALVGKKAIAAFFTQVFSSVFRPEDTTLAVTAEIVSGDFALVHWTAETSNLKTSGGFDTFTLRDGKIIAQCGGAQVLEK